MWEIVRWQLFATFLLNKDKQVNSHKLIVTLVFQGDGLTSSQYFVYLDYQWIYSCSTLYIQNYWI